MINYSVVKILLETASGQGSYFDLPITDRTSTIKLLRFDKMPDRSCKLSLMPPPRHISLDVYYTEMEDMLCCSMFKLNISVCISSNNIEWALGRFQHFGGTYCLNIYCYFCAEDKGNRTL